MATDTLIPPDEDQDRTNDPIQQYYDSEFAALTSAEHQAKAGVSGDIGSDEEGSLLRNENGDQPSERRGKKKDDSTGDKDGHEEESKPLDPNDQAAVGEDLYNPGGAMARRFLPFSWSRRKSVTSGIVGLLLGGGLFFGLGISSGPLQVIHLGEVLGHSFSKSESDSSIRTRHLFRYARAAKSGVIGETRVGILGSKVFGQTISQLKDIGIEIETGKTGQPTRTTIDTEKLKGRFPELDGMSDSEQKAFIADKIGIDASTITGSGGKFAIDQSDMNIRSARFLSKSTVGLLDDGKIVSAVKARTLTKVFDLPSLLHPWQRAKASLFKKFVNGGSSSSSEEEEAVAEEAQLQEEVTTTASGDGAVAETADAKGKVSGFTSGLTKALTFTGAACIVYRVANDIPKIDEARVVLPAAAEATTRIAQASQTKSGQDMTAAQVGAVVSSFTDKNGDSIWASKPLQTLALSSNTKSLKDISSSQKQAFSSHSTVDAINAAADKVAPSWLGGPNTVCSNASLLIQGLATITLAAIQTIGTAGTATPAVIAEFGAKQAVQFVVSMAAMKLVTDLVLNSTTADALAKNAFQGPAGGALLAYGSRAAANQAAVSNGGVSISNNESTVIATNEAAADKRQFESESMFARMFDAKDYRSLLGRLSDSITPSFSQNVTHFAASLPNIGGSLLNSFGSLLPAATADSSNSSYNWGFPQMGIPQSLLDDPNLSDPYTNADQVAHLLDGECRSGSTVQKCSGNTDYIGKIKACFGLDVTLTQDTGSQNYVWDTSLPTGSSIDTQTNDYLSASCDNLSDQNWRRIIMWVNDSGDMKAAACYQGDAQSCQDLGATPSNTATTTQTSDFTVATYNMCQETNHPNCMNVGQKVPLISSFILGQSKAPQLDIIGAEELSQPTQKGIMNTLRPQGYDSYPEQVPADQGRAVFWNTNKFSLVDSGKLGGVYSNDGTLQAATGEHAFPWVGLKTADGHTIYVLATHSPNNNYDAGGSDRAKNAQAILAWAKSKSGNGNVVIVTGDFNVSGTRFGQNSPYCILTGSILQHAHDMQDGHDPSKSCPTPNPPHYAPLDSIYASTGDQLTASGWTWMGEGGVNKNVTGTDHSPSYVTLSFPGGGSSAGGSASIADTYGPACNGQGGSTYGVTCSGQCVDYVQYLLDKTYNAPGKYNGGLTGAKMVAHIIAVYGFKSDATAEVGDVVSWPKGGVPGSGGQADGGAGHVAAVIKVNSDGSIVVAEYNYLNNGPVQVAGHSFDTRSIPASTAAELTYAHTNLKF